MSTTVLRLISVAPFMIAGLPAGCASVPLASKSSDQLAKQFSALNDSGRVYCYRPNVFGRNMITLPLVLDGKRKCSLAPRTFVYFDLPPGSHTIATFNPKDSMYGTVFPIKLDIRAGDLIFLWHGLKASGGGLAARLIRKDETRAKAGVRRCRLVNVSQMDQ